MTFGRAMLQHWTLDPASTYLNHGTVGVVPRRVLHRQQALRDEMERHPSRFVLRELNGEQPAPWRSVVATARSDRAGGAVRRRQARRSRLRVERHHRDQRRPRLGAVGAWRRGGDHGSRLRSGDARGERRLRARRRHAAHGTRRAIPFAKRRSSTRSSAR